MRILEPKRHFRSARRDRKQSKKKLLFALLAIFVVGVLIWRVQQSPSTTSKTNTSNAQPSASTQPAASKKSGSLKTFTPEQFRLLYSTFAYPNVQELANRPRITGNTTADARIVSIAERRGFRLRSIPVNPIVRTGEPNLEGDDLLQERAYQGWQHIKAAAQKDGVPLHLLSGYRSIEYQRDLFVSRLRQAGGDENYIAGGEQDAIVNSVLSLTAPPGYSRHHTGYTVDFSCMPNGQFIAFGNSSCFAWLSANNYQKAKESGWVPSYPSGATDQGPEPEPWEYVWVGVDAVTNE